MDKTKIKNFFVSHFEKMILAAVVGLSGFLVIQGLGLPHFTDDNDPGKLTLEANQVKSRIDENRTEAITADRLPELDVLAMTEAIKNRVDPSPYKPKNTLQRTRLGSVVRRQDPLLRAPESIITTRVVAAIAWQNRNPNATPDDYRLFELDPADPIETDDKPAPRANRSRDRASRNDEGDDAGGFGLGGLTMGNRNDSTTGTTAIRRFSNANNHGADPKTVAGNPPIPRVFRFIAGAAVVPHKELYEAYHLALQDADAYSVDRDSPIYANFEVQRADVTKKSVDQLTDQDWLLAWSFNHSRIVAADHWAGYAPEIVPPEYRDNLLSNWIPPVLLDDYRTFVTHPLIPMVPRNELEEEDEEPVEDEKLNDDEIFGDNATRSFAPRARSGSRLGGLGSRLGTTRKSGRSRSGSQGEEEIPVDYKLVRFYDFYDLGRTPPKLGAQYVYRIRFSIVDPNFPELRELQPKRSSLAPEVAKRVGALKEEAAKTGIRKFQRWSPWSKPSEPVSLPGLSQQFAGPVDPGTTYLWSVAGKKVEYARSAPKGKIVTSQFDETLDGRVSFLIDVQEGSVLSYRADADVVDPISMEIKKLPDAEVRNTTTVIDLAGGAPLKIFEDMSEPGMMLLFDQNGNLTVADEVDDLESYRAYSYAEEREE